MKLLYEPQANQEAPEGNANTKCHALETVHSLTAANGSLLPCFGYSFSRLYLKSFGTSMKYDVLRLSLFLREENRRFYWNGKGKLEIDQFTF